ncbi:Hypothetical predicted protein [Cloeon dipterum]|uniref:Heparan-alpha-glucosaminide N-acetyltransferase catalytic domain-containing protein n=2 Tax=Cloeon dipterum TaxID=197152 RepID=A0A8S1CIP4_9INSE|nr:Hypothetical predicted protein [Cloeon dipterum]
MLLQSWMEGRVETPVRGLRLHDLGLDQAYLNVTNLLDREAFLYSVKDACYKCPYSFMSALPAGDSKIFKVNSAYSIRPRIYGDYLGEYVSTSNHSSLECNVDSAWHFGEFGIYDLLVQPGGKCTTSTYYEPVNIYRSAVSVTVIVLFLLCLGQFIKGVAKSWGKQEQVFIDNNNQNDSKGKIEEILRTKKPRLRALDAFRGLIVIPLIFYTHQGGGYQVLEHASWEGLPIADWPFPWFIWIMGVCMPMGINSNLERQLSRRTILFHVAKRSVLLFALGISTNCINYGLAYETFRFFNALQRFGIMCLINASLCAILWPRDISKIKGRFADLQIMWSQWAIHIVLHVISICLVFFLPVPGCPTGYLGPGGLSEDRKYENCTGGTFGYVNKLLMNEANMEQNPTAKAVYEVNAFDPEGYFSNLPSLLTVILGIQAGAILVIYNESRERISRWTVWGVGCILLALILELTGAIPINKQLWSTSFALITAGFAFLFLAAFYLLIDVKKCWNGFPFVEPGVNCLFIYIGSKLTNHLWPFHWRIGPMDTHFILLADTIWACWLWLLIAKWLFKRNIIITV